MTPVFLYPLIRVHKIKNHKYKWHIGNVTRIDKKDIFIDYEKARQVNKSDNFEMNSENTCMIIWLGKHKKYAINMHTNNSSELTA